MSEKVVITREEATKDTLEKMQKVLRRIAKRFPDEEANEFFYTEEEMKKLIFIK